MSFPTDMKKITRRMPPEARADTSKGLPLKGRSQQDVFDYIEMFHNPKREHVSNGMLSPVEFERQQKT